MKRNVRLALLLLLTVALMCAAMPMALGSSDMADFSPDQLLTLEQALTLYPELPLPETFQGLPLQCCKVAKFSLQEAPANKSPFEIIAIYSDEKALKSISFYSVPLKDDRVRIPVTENGFILKGVLDKANTIVGIGLTQGENVIYCQDGDVVASEAPWSISDYSLLSGTSKATSENAADLLVDAELTGLFDALIAFVHPK